MTSGFAKRLLFAAALATSLSNAVVAQQRLTSSNSWVTMADLQKLGVTRNGTSIFLTLTVAPTGKLERCSANLRYGTIKASQAICDLVAQRARFEPRHRPDGAAIRATDRIGFRIEHDALIPTLDLGGAHLVDMYISPSNYPSKAFGAGLEGLVRVALKTGIDGRATDCRIIKTSNVESLDTETCRQAYKGFLIEPVRDHAGKPSEGTAVISVCWSYETLLSDSDPCR